MRVVLLGAPGAGKGTQCKRIVAQYGLVHLSSGDILRQERAAGSELGKKAQAYMDAGDLVPDDLIVEMMAAAVARAPAGGYVLDGFPRTVNQAEQLDGSLDQGRQKIDIVLNLEVNDETVAKRITGRRSCPQCGAVYHVENLKPKVDGQCDNDDAQLVQRPDDTLDVVMNRLKTYHDQTKPIVDYYRQNTTVYDIDADRDIDEIRTEIFQKLDALASVQG